MRKIFISGSEGKIATSLLVPLIKSLGEYEIIRFDKVLGDDLLDKDSIMRKLMDKNVDTVIHTAAIAGPTKTERKELYEKVNTEGSINLIKIASKNKVKKFVFFSSFSYYGVDAWMRYREETGPITGRDVVVPKYLPIDEDHPSILEYDLSKLTNYNGKYYGMSKANVERFARDNASDLNCSFISMRLAGFSKKRLKYLQRKEDVLKKSKMGISDMRKQVIYGLAGITTKSILAAALEAILKSDHEKYDAYNVCEPNKGLRDVTKLYFPDLKPADTIFTNQKILDLISRTGTRFLPEPEEKDYKKILRLIKKIVLFK